MAQSRLPYDLADLPAEMPLSDVGGSYSPFERSALGELRTVLNNPGVGGFDMAPTTLASIGARLSPGSGPDAVGYSPAFLGGFEASARKNSDRGNIRTAFLQGLGVVGDAAQSAPSIGLAVGNEIKPILPGHPVERFEPEREPGQRRRMWPPVQIDLPRFDAPMGVPQRITDLFAKPGLEDLMMQHVGAGMTMMGGANWFDTKWLRDEFVKELGHNAGTAAFYDLIDFIAATSPGSDVGTNIRNATRYFNKFRRGEDVGGDNPYPYGHWLADLHKKLASAVAEGGLDPVQYPKITSFAENLRGNYTPVTVDIHALRLPAMLARDANFLKRTYREMLDRGELSMDEAVANPSYWRNPYPNEYPVIEQFYKRLAARANLLPAEAQAAAWLGGGHITGLRSKRFKSFKEYFDDRISRTAKEKGLSEEDVWRQFLRGELDLVLLDGQPNTVT